MPVGLGQQDHAVRRLVASGQLGQFLLEALEAQVDADLAGVLGEQLAHVVHALGLLGYVHDVDLRQSESLTR